MKKILNINPDKLTLLWFGTGAGNAPQFYTAKGTKQFLSQLDAIKELFNEDGTFNSSFSNAEEYAMCLIEEGKKVAALELLDLIVFGSSDILLKPLKGGDTKMIANQKGKLGMEGMYQYAHLLKEANRVKEAGKFFLEIIDADLGNSAIRGGDIKENSAKWVLELKAYPLLQQSKYLKLYKKFQDESY